MISFVCTTINPEAPLLKENIKFFNDNSVQQYIILDRKVNSKYGVPYINFRDAPNNEYERICPWDSYSRKNIGFLRANDANLSVFETDDDNLFKGSIEDLCPDWETKFKTYTSQNITNLFRNIYPHVSDTIWARGLPLQARNFDELSQTEQLMPAGVIQYLVDGNPDVDAIYRLVNGNEVDIKASDEALPVAISNTFHPFNSQGTLWPHKNLRLAYLPSTCSFRMTDIWRGYIAQAILYRDNQCVVFHKPKLKQKRNIHDISEDFFGEWLGYKQVADVIDVITDIKGDSQEDMLLDCYSRLVSKGIFDKTEIILLQAYLDEF